MSKRGFAFVVTLLVMTAVSEHGDFNISLLVGVNALWWGISAYYKKE